MRQGEDLCAPVRQRLGYVPAFLETAAATPRAFESLWQQMLLAYLDNPLPDLLKEKLLAYLSRYCSHPYCLVYHSCRLRELGMSAGQIASLLRRPTPMESEVPGHIDAVRKLSGMPEDGSQAAWSVFWAAVELFLNRQDADQCAKVLRKAIGQEDYDLLIALIGYLRAAHLWVQTHPRVNHEKDPLVRQHLRSLRAEAPAIEELFDANAQRLERDEQGRAERIVSRIAQQAQAAELMGNCGGCPGTALLQSPFPVMIYAEDGQVLQINDVWTELSGYGLADIPTMMAWCRRAQPGTEPHSTQDIDALFESDQRVEEGEHVIGTRQGGERIWDFASVPLGRLADGRRAILRVASDVTERRHLEESLWQTTRRTANILESISDAFYSLDREFQLVYVNERAEEMMQRARQDLIGKRLWDEFPQVREMGLAEHVQRAVAEARTVHAELRELRSARWFEFRIYPSAEGVSIHVREITGRVKMAKKLENTNRLLEAMVAASPLAVLAVDDQSRVVLWSPAAERIFGWKAAEVIGKPLPTIPEGQQEQRRAMREDARAQKKPVYFETKRLTRSGRVIDAAVWAAPMNGEAVAGMALIGDITERKRAEEALVRSEQRNAALLRAIPDAMFQVDRQGKFLDCVAPRHDLLAVPASELLGRRMRDVLPAEAAAQALRAVSEALDKATTPCIEYSLLAQGETRYYEARFAACGPDEVLVITREISDRKRAEEAAHESSEAMSAVVRASPMAIIVLDLEGKVKLWNPAAGRLFGWSESEVIGRPLPIIPPGHEQQFVENRKRLLQGRWNGTIQVPCLRKDASQVITSLSIAVVHDRRGQVRSLLGMMWEVGASDSARSHPA